MATNRHRYFCFSCFSSSAEAGSLQRDDCAASSSNQTQPALRNIIQKEDIAASSSSNQTQPALRKIIRKEDIAASSSNQTKPALRNIIQKEDIVKVEGEFVVDTHKLIQHISELLELRRKGKLRQEQSSKPNRSFESSSVPWFNKLKEILSLGTDMGTDIKKLAVDFLKPGLDLVSALKDIISGPVKILVTDIAKASLATAGLLLVAYTLEGFDNLSSNQDECWFILEQMSFVANVVERLEASPKVIQDLIEGATILIAEGAIMCCSKMDSSPWKNFFISKKIKQDLSGITERLKVMYMQINIEIGFRIFTAMESKGRSPIFTAMESKGRSPLSRGYPTHAVGLKEPVEEVLRLLKIESDDQNAVTVILHGFGGMGKTTLADAVVSSVGGCKYSKVVLPVDINPPPDVIVKLQTEILTDLMETEQSMPNFPNFRAYDDGRRELETVLQKVQAFIYIDNVLEPAALKMLLPLDLTKAKNVRILLTTRNVKVKTVCPWPCTNPGIYTMKGIKHEEAMIVLQKKIKKGISESQFKEIINTCGGIPLMLEITAPMIGGADDKQKAYATLMEQKDKWTGEDFKEMRYAFAYTALPPQCKDPFLDICTFFNGWKWDIVEDIAGQDELGTLQNRALVTRTPDGFASVHDVILTLGRQMSNEESEDKEGKQVRWIFPTAQALKNFLEEEDTKGIKGIWLTTNTEELPINASTLEPMRNSLRVLRLGKVEGNSNKIFQKLVFFEAKITQLPFVDVSRQLEQLRYLSCTADTVMPSPLPSKLRFMNFEGRMFREVPKATIYNDEVAPMQSASTSY